MAGYVLVVDDDPVIRFVYRKVINRSGLVVREAESAEAALALIAAELPGLILLDVMMPDMNGTEFYRRLQQNPRTRRVPVIVVSALSPAELDQSLVNATLCIQKCRFTMDELSANVTHLAG